MGCERSGAFTKEHGAHRSVFRARRIGDRLVDPFFNINRPEDLGYAAALLREAP